MFRSRKLSYSYPSTTGQINADYADLPLKKLLVNIPVTQTGSGTPSPDNIRDFIGVSGVNIQRTGKNLYFDTDIIDGTRRELKNVNIPVGTYTISADVVSSDTEADTCLVYDATNSGALGLIERGSRKSMTFTTDKPIEQIWFYASRNNTLSTGKTFSFTNIQIERGSEATPYEPYTGNTYQITLGQTVYSAYLNVLTGVLSITHIRKAMSDLGWAIVTDEASGFGYDYFRSSGNIEDMKDFIGVLCDCLENNNHTRGELLDNEIGHYNSSNYGRRLVCRADSITTIEDWNTFIADKYIVYELATPIEIPLGGIDIKTLQGINNIFADIGTVETQCIRLGN